MRLRWLAITSVTLLFTSLLLATLGPQLWTSAYFGGRPGWLPCGGMGGYGMMGGYDTAGGYGGALSGDLSQPFDRRFLDQMVPHHQMAVHSAQVMLASSERPELRDLARRIISAQQAEITQMVAWRAAWYPDAPPGPWMPMSRAGIGRGGMLGGQEQMSRLFLEMMIPHHASAIEMARQALVESQRPEIHGLAETIISSQTAEIEEMRGYLREFYGVTTR